MKLNDESKEPGGIGFWEKRINHNDDVGFFLIAQHLPIKNIQVMDGDIIRCDATAKTGPQGFHTWDGSVCSCGRTDEPYGLTAHHYLTFPNMAAIYPIIEAVPSGHILYFELLNPEDEVKLIKESHSDGARTLQEVFRLLLEWDFAYTELGNRERIAEVSHGIVQILDIPENIKTWILSEVPGEKVSRFLAGLPDAQERADSSTIPPLTDEFSEWLHDKITHTRPIGGYDS